VPSLASWLMLKAVVLDNCHPCHNPSFTTNCRYQRH
jgi:hypothetical protein